LSISIFKNALTLRIIYINIKIVLNYRWIFKGEVVKMLESNSVNDSINIRDFQEVISLIGKLNDKQKELVLATLRGAVMIADSNTREE